MPLGTTLILAAGQSSRWNWPAQSKHLVEVNGEMLLLRTCRQVRERGSQPIVVTRDLRLVVDNSTTFIPERCETACATLLSTRNLWTETTTVLLGDVFFAEEAMNIVARSEAPFCFFGNGADIFALKLTCPAEAARLETALRSATVREPKLCRLHEVEGAMGAHEPERYIHLAAPTQDFDTINDWWGWRAGNYKGAATSTPLHPSSQGTSSHASQ